MRGGLDRGGEGRGWVMGPGLERHPALTDPFLRAPEDRLGDRQSVLAASPGTATAQTTRGPGWGAAPFPASTGKALLEPACLFTRSPSRNRQKAVGGPQSGPSLWPSSWAVRLLSEPAAWKPGKWRRSIRDYRPQVPEGVRALAGDTHVPSPGPIPSSI